MGVCVYVSVTACSRARACVSAFAFESKIMKNQIILRIILIITEYSANTEFLLSFFF